MIYDVVTYNGEKDLFDLRYNILKDVVDEFIVVEFDRTFSGNIKSPTFLHDPDLKPKVKYKLHTLNDYTKYRDLALQSPNTKGADHWKLEFMQKESIKDAISHLQDNDTVFIGDCDEIWKPLNYLPLEDEPIKLHQIVYTYWLNNRSSEDWWGTLYTRYGLIKDKCLNHIRTTAVRDEGPPDSGWHFTSMGGYEEVKRKLSDSYTRESYWTEGVESSLAQNMAQNKDFLGRGFEYRRDEGDWPVFLRENRERYKHLIK